MVYIICSFSINQPSCTCSSSIPISAGQLPSGSTVMQICKWKSSYLQSVSLHIFKLPQQITVMDAVLPKKNLIRKMMLFAFAQSNQFPTLPEDAMCICLSLFNSPPVTDWLNNVLILTEGFIVRRRRRQKAISDFIYTCSEMELEWLFGSCDMTWWYEVWAFPWILSGEIWFDWCDVVGIANRFPFVTTFLTWILRLLTKWTMS